MQALVEGYIEARSSTGVVVARVRIVPFRASESGDAPLVEIDADEAARNAEGATQLRESERYEYEVFSQDGRDLRLRCSLASRRRSLGPTGAPDAGLIETRSFCGTLLLELVEGEVDDDKPSIASAQVEVRSVKLAYRSDYRGMLRRLAEELAGLVADSRSSAKTSFQSTYELRRDRGWFQIQLELLRDALESAEFSAALQRILAYPHERLSASAMTVDTSRPVRWTNDTARQLVARNPRRAVPESHPLRHLGLESVARTVVHVRKVRDVDTPENRFVKFALEEFRAFLSHAQWVFESASGWAASASLARRLAAIVDDWLSRALFRQVGALRMTPVASPVLQRKAGYRECLRYWLRFHLAADLSWSGGAEAFRAGQRDVATLYEYWLFFELLTWFCATFREGSRPAVDELVEGLGTDAANLRLRRGVALGPFDGQYEGFGRRLNVRFTYNRRFGASEGRGVPGSWTRSLHPDYTLSFWPDGLTEAEAEQREVLVHVHLDAKYRIEDIENLFGATGSEDADLDLQGSYKRQDLLKMHAYRDAIKRSQGAYVLYPGRHQQPEVFRAFHEVLPGLGAFAVAPGSDGRALGIETLSRFLDDVLRQLSNRTTMLERVGFHLDQAGSMKEAAIEYGAIRLEESDIYGKDRRALPPAEHMVLVAWYRDRAQLEWTQRTGLAIVRLGKRVGGWHVPPDFASARHLLLHTRGGASSPGLWRLKTPGYRVFTDRDLRNAGYPRHPGGEIYALFEVEPDAAWKHVSWDPRGLIRALRDFESRIRYRLVKNVGRRSAYPRIVALRDLLKAQASSSVS